MSFVLQQQSLRGLWETGVGRSYSRTVTVPGIANDPEKMDADTVWYRKQITLPPGDWTYATLTLLGARFCPSIYIEGELVSKSRGGMAPTHHLLRPPHVYPGAVVTLEIALQSLKDIDARDASRIPEADSWRSNISSCLWDDALLRFHGPTFITRLLPHYDWDHDEVEIRWSLGGAEQSLNIALQILDAQDTVLAETELLLHEQMTGRAVLDLRGRCQPWTPDKPNLYRLRGRLLDGDTLLDTIEQNFGVRSFRTKGLGFELNHQPITLRAGSVVWHRWTRDPEGRTLAFDTAWFEENIVKRLKRHGANMLRFHLGMPPREIIDLCDRHGLLVQAEWSFFHGLKASRESAVEQWRSWFDECLRHPSICLFHPWNETEGAEIITGFKALETLTPEYPPLVLAHRDVLHLHRYWWSIFENVGLYYDSFRQFDQPVMADEFGGNYLDGDGNAGGYPMLAESFLRFLGHNHTAALRLQLHAESNARIAEYWRRIGVAGFSPFCLLGSPPDGNSHFLGPVREGRPKQTWDALTAAYATGSCSLDLWDRNFLPGQTIEVPLVSFNDRPMGENFSGLLRIVPETGGPALWEQPLHRWMEPFSRATDHVKIPLPSQSGPWAIEVELLEPLTQEKRPISRWRIRTLRPIVPAISAVAVPECETEIREFLTSAGIRVVPVDDPSASVVLAGAASWAQVEPETAVWEAALQRGASVVMLDVGPRDLGMAYRPEGSEVPPLEVPDLKEPRRLNLELFAGLHLHFHELPEPESCFHPSLVDHSLWQHLDQQATWLWNGLRGGLVAPAWDMKLSSLPSKVLLSFWQERGADPQAIQSGHCIAYEQAGFFAYSPQPDPAVEKQLRDRLRFLTEDAPALKLRLNPDGRIEQYDLGSLYRESQASPITNFIPLANCGKNLTRVPVAEIHFGPARGKLFLSQLLTAGRLLPHQNQPGICGLRYDPAAAQFIWNLLERAAIQAGKFTQP